MKDLIAARVETGRPIHFEVDDVSVHELESERPLVRYRHAGEQVELSCDVVAGCDGFHGICRDSIPDGVLDRLLARVPVRLARHPRARRRRRARS